MKDRKTHDTAPPLRVGLRESLARVRESCTDCGACRNECAFLQKYGTPGEIALGYDPAAPQFHSMPFECSLCRLCTSVCPVDVNPARMFLEMRREAVERGRGTFPEHRGLLGYERTGMSQRFTYYGLPEGCETVLFPGCTFPGTRPDRTKEIFERLRKEDPCLGIVLDCCGRISESLGRDAFSRAMMDEMSAYLVEHGVREVIVVCPNCYDMFKEYGTGLHVRMVYEVLPMVKDDPGVKRGKVVLHDPCGTRFHSDCHDAVRRHLDRAGVVFHDMDQRGSRPCAAAAGPGSMLLSPDLAGRWMERTAAEVKGRMVATYCAGCTRKMALAFKNRPCPRSALRSRDGPERQESCGRGAMTYLNRLRLKGHFRKTIHASASRERTYWARERPKGALCRALVLVESSRQSLQQESFTDRSARPGTPSGFHRRHGRHCPAPGHRPHGAGFAHPGSVPDVSETAPGRRVPVKFLNGKRPCAVPYTWYV